MQSEIYETQILEHHLDSFGHVNNAEYLILFEQARWELVTKGGYGLAQVFNTGKGPIVLEIGLKFKKELRLRDRIRIFTKCTPFHKKITHVLQEIHNEKNEVCTLADFTMSFFDLQTRRLIEPTREWLLALGLGLAE